MVVDGLQQDNWSRAGSDVPGQGWDVVGVDGVFNLAGGQATELRTGSDGGADFAGGGGVAVVNASPAVFADEVTVTVTSLTVAGVVAANVHFCSYFGQSWDGPRRCG